MRLVDGFRLDRPNVLIPWNISPGHLLELLEARSPDFGGLRKITNAYFGLRGEALGLSTSIGFHFSRQGFDQVELFDAEWNDLMDGFARYQEALVRTFGTPTNTLMIGDNFPAHEWKINGFRILHFIQERFGPERHLRILAPGATFSYDPFQTTRARDVQ